MEQIYSTPIELRFSDLDLYGHVNSVAYFSFLETARVKMFENLFRELTGKNIFLLVARAECDYKTAILFGDALVVSISVPRIGTASFDLDYLLHDGTGKNYANARTTMVCFDNVNKSTIAVPQCIRDMQEKPT
ncbi:MAG: acyl-CoA thioesterase [Desulfuromonadaceae bacterium]|nr:acyl-CoA thioesterase [Desulfuromonadaceae bacterium]MDD5104477.1 acyl-CoA thioesterase [Desulfuromonadaceae bacterium]